MVLAWVANTGHQRPTMTITMQMYPGSESEIPMLKKCIDSARKQNFIINKTIRVADKGLNCGKNIYEAIKSGDGYIYFLNQLLN